MSLPTLGELRHLRASKVARSSNGRHSRKQAANVDRCNFRPPHKAAVDQGTAAAAARQRAAGRPVRLRFSRSRRARRLLLLCRSRCRTSPSTLWSRPGLPHGRHPRSGTGLRTRPATTSRPDYQPAGGQEVADSHSLSTLWRYASSCNFNNFGVLAFFRGCFRSLCLCRGAFGQLLAFGSHSLLDVTTLSSATTCPVLLPCDPVTAL